MCGSVAPRSSSHCAGLRNFPAEIMEYEAVPEIQESPKPPPNTKKADPKGPASSSYDSRPLKMPAHPELGGDVGHLEGEGVLGIILVVMRVFGNLASEIGAYMGKDRDVFA